MTRAIIIYLIFLMSPCSQSYPYGAPCSSVETMRPKHSTGKPQFNVKPQMNIVVNNGSNCYSNNHKNSVVLIGKKDFVGFSLQARFSNVEQIRAGQFLIGDGIQNIKYQCDEMGAVTHRKNYAERKVNVSWKSSLIHGDAPVVFVATIIMNKKRDWYRVRSDDISPCSSEKSTTIPIKQPSKTSKSSKECLPTSCSPCICVTNTPIRPNPKSIALTTHIPCPTSTACTPCPQPLKDSFPATSTPCPVCSTCAPSSSLDSTSCPPPITPPPLTVKCLSPLPSPSVGITPLDDKSISAKECKPCTTSPPCLSTLFKSSPKPKDISLTTSIPCPASTECTPCPQPTKDSFPTTSTSCPVCSTCVPSSSSDSVTEYPPSSCPEQTCPPFSTIASRVNNDPDAQDDRASLKEDTFAEIAVLNNDSDPDGDSFSIITYTQPLKGNLTLANGNFTYTPNENFNGQDSFAYSVSDRNGGYDSATVIINVRSVDDAPVAYHDQREMMEDTEKIFSITPATDGDGDKLFYSISNVTNGNATFDNSENLAPNIIFKPNANFFGKATIKYSVSDSNNGENIGQVTIRVINVNDNPEAQDDIISTPEDTEATINVSINDIDPDVGSVLSVVNYTTPANGTLQLMGNNFTYTPNHDFNGPDTFSYTISDEDGGSDTATVIILVDPVNDPPVAVIDERSTDQHTALLIDVLRNDYDPDGDDIFVVDTRPVLLRQSGTLELTNDNYMYTPNGIYSGRDWFSYVISDGKAESNYVRVHITIRPG